MILLFYTACQKYSYIEHDLHGLWQVTTVEDKMTGEITEAEGDLFYSFQRNMVIVSYNVPSKPTGQMMTQYISDFILQDDSIQINNFRIYLEYDKKAPLEMLQKFGIHAEHTTFVVDKAKKGIMTLESDKARVELQRY